MKIGAMNNPRADFLGEINWILANDFDCIDLAYEPPLSEKKGILPVAKQLIGKVQIIGHTNPTIPAVYPINKIREISMSELKRSINFFQALGVKKITIHPFYKGLKKEKDLINENIKILRELVDYSKNKNIIIMLENFIWPFESAGAISKIVKAVPELYLHLDIGHLNLEGDPVKMTASFFHRFGDKILHIHMHDNLGETDQHLPLGCGDVEWEKIIKILKLYNYNESVTLEVFCADKNYILYSKKVFLEMWAGKA